MTIEQLFQAQKKQSWQQRKLTRKEAYRQRRDDLKKIFRAISAREADICTALKEDFHKSELETVMSEIYPVLQEIRSILKNLESWMQPESVSTPWMLTGCKSEIHYEAKGVVLVIAPWNYPFQLALLPLITALAAGNCVMLKPSELTPKTSALIEKLVTDLFPANQVAVVQGDKEVSQQLLQFPFDHIFFTGSTQVGRIVMEAASKHLSPVTLELGGKSPTIIDETADLDLAASKVLWGKFVNAGQTCVAPDYLLVQAGIHKSFVKKLKEHLDTFSQNLSGDFAHIISERHLQRLNTLLTDALSKEALLVAGGQVDYQTKSMSPTILEKVSPDLAIMSEEIFGPLLPILNFNQVPDVISFINQRPKPLALYIFSGSEENIERILRETSAGGVTVNDTLLHFANHFLPFGGVGESGLGSYHGSHGFRTFSHAKSVLRQSWMGRFFKVLYPPYSNAKLNLVRKISQWGL